MLSVATFQSLTVWSPLAEASVPPSGLKATELTDFWCPTRLKRTLPVATSHRRSSPGDRPSIPG